MTPELPYLGAVQAYASQSASRLHVPGHHGGAGSPRLRTHLGGRALRADLTEVLDLDDIHQPFGPCREAQQQAARLFGADHTYFLVNGSSCGNQAMLMAALRPGQTVLMPRNAHRSGLAGLQLSGARPAYFTPTWDAEREVYAAPTAGEIEAALNRHPEARALWLTSPSYHGACPDLRAIVALARTRDLVVLVDEAWGAHLAFHPDLPDAAMQCGADLAVQSTHKRLGALTQASMLHLAGSRIDRDRLEYGLRTLQTSSPSTLLLASLDAARADMQEHGRERWQEALHLSAWARAQIERIHPLRCFACDDPTRLLIRVAGAGWTGPQAERFLWERHRVQVELSDASNLLALVGLGHRRSHLNRLLRGLRGLVQADRPGLPRRPVEAPPQPRLALTPREALESEWRPVPLAGSRGSISAEMICPYPPGIPAICPGEVIDGEVIEYLQRARAVGVRLQGAFDPDLESIRVVRT